MWRAVQKVMDVRWLLALFAGLLLSGIWGMTLWQLGQDARQAADSASRDARDLVLLFREHASRTIAAADQSVMFLRERYNQQGLRLDMAQELKTNLGASDLYHLYSIIDAKGDVVLSTKPFSPVNLSDRPHIRVHMQQRPDTLYISVPVLGRVSHQWSLQLTRRISKPDGAYNGVVVVSMDPNYFTRLYREVDVGKLGTIALVGEDGVVRARRAGDQDSIGQDISGSPLFAAMRDKRSGTGEFMGAITARVRYFSFARLGDLPLYAVVGLDKEEVMANHAQHRQQTLRLAAITSAIVVAFTSGLIFLIGRLIESREQAYAASRAKSRFLSNMSHELRTPLNGVLGYSELLQSEFGDSRQGKFASAIHECGERLLGLVESVLELSELESGKAALQVQPEPLEDLLRQALAAQRIPAREKQLGLELLLAPDLPHSYVCDRSKLQRVLDLLLRNAIQATSQGDVTLEAEPGPGRVLLRVRDTGPGVPEAVRQRLFEQFTTADDSASRARDGAGLGLAIAARLVQIMGGRLSLESSGADGAVFAISLPFLRLAQSRELDKFQQEQPT
jgi:signal transduction histidine kinase